MENPMIKYMLCTECKKIYGQNIQYLLILGISLIVIGVFSFLIATRFYSYNIIHELIAMVIASIPWTAGMLVIIRTQDKVTDCNICHTKKSLIAVDTHDAIEFIKANNLSLPKPKPKESKHS